MTGPPPERIQAQGEMLANRAGKNARHLAKWARRAGVTCYRIYDRDIPELPLTIDWYDGRLVVYRHVKDDDDLRGGDWLAAMGAAVARGLGVAPGDVFLKERQRQRGAAQYERAAELGARFVVTEGGHRFRVNLSDYLDTGLFLDHRITRGMIGAAAAGKRFLNLFCYTGAFTVHAAAGGAVASTSVDLSNTYLAWAADNLELNGLATRRHELVAADVRTWLDEARARGDCWDLAFLDPPTFSNSKRMDGVLDLQRDHVELIRATFAVLSPSGEVWFSTNQRRFRLDEEALAPTATDGGFAIEDITGKTIPPDFREREGGAKAHRAWILRRAGRLAAPR